MGSGVLGLRQRNRTLLERQLLLRRTAAGVEEAVEHLVGLQAQEPPDPYVALWNRLEGFRPEDLGELLEARRVVRGTLMRGTIHLVTARDFLDLWPVMRPLLERMFRTTPWGRALREDGEPDPPHEALVAGRELVEERPMTNAEVEAALAARWPDLDAAALARAARYLLPMVQVPPRGVWGRTGRATHTTVEHWVGRPLGIDPTPDRLVLRYLAAFGPASVPDARAWCGLPGLREAVERVRPGLRSFRDDRGRELLDLPHAPLGDPETPAPPRFLPTYDNVLLGHEDRRLTGTDEDRRWLLEHVRTNVGTLLVDGFVRGVWRFTRDGGRTTLRVQPLRRLSRSERSEVEEEGADLLAFQAPRHDHDIQLGDVV